MKMIKLDFKIFNWCNKGIIYLIFVVNFGNILLEIKRLINDCGWVFVVVECLFVYSGVWLRFIFLFLVFDWLLCFGKLVKYVV